MINSYLLLALLGVPLLAVLASVLVRSDRTRYALVVPSALITFGLALTLIARVLSGGPIRALGDWLYLDDLNAIVLLVVMFVSTLAGAYSVAYFRSSEQGHVLRPGELRKYFSLFHLFTFTMVLATVSGNLALLWTAVTATTFASAPISIPAGTPNWPRTVSRTSVSIRASEQGSSLGVSAPSWRSPWQLPSGQSCFCSTSLSPVWTLSLVVSSSRFSWRQSPTTTSASCCRLTLSPTSNGSATT